MRSQQISIHASAREATSYRSMRVSCTGNFNPRLREGGDLMRTAINYAIGISIHASAREATEVDFSVHYDTIISIHASAREATDKYAY